jgi:anti-anti-sigma regulatory factor
MQVTVDQIQIRVLVTILAIHGDLDASNYEQVIAKARELYAAGWQAFHSIDHARVAGVHQQVKLLSPQPKVSRTLQMTSMDDFFEIHTDKQAAIASF